MSSTLNLKHDEFVPHAPEYEGSVRINHESSVCSGSSKSMVIRREKNGDIVAYCHRCGKSGSYRSPFFKGDLLGKDTRRERGRDNEGYRNFESESSSFISSVTAWDKWPRHVRMWLQGFGISEVESVRNSLSYNEEIDELMIPIRNTKGLVGYLCRTFTSKTRYYATFKNSACSFWLSTGYGHDSDTLVITEDVISAIKCARYLPAMALLSTKIMNCAMSEIVNRYKHFIIFLDDDTPLVKENQRALRNKLELFGDVRIVTVGRDPKRCTGAELKEVLMP